MNNKEILINNLKQNLSDNIRVNTNSIGEFIDACQTLLDTFTRKQVTVFINEVLEDIKSSGLPLQEKDIIKIRKRFCL